MDTLQRIFMYPLVAMLLLLCLPLQAMAAAPPVRIAVFNFRASAVETSQYATTVTNMLMGCLKRDQAVSVLDRKDLESFLSLNELEQNDNVANVVDIGTRLNLGAIVAGSVTKKGAVITVACKVVHVEQKRTILTTYVKTFGDEALAGEMPKLSRRIVDVITGSTAEKEQQKPVIGGPVHLQVRPGSKKISLYWEDPPGETAASYEIVRSKDEDGPFVKIAQVKVREYGDHNVERNTSYFYRVRFLSVRGDWSAYSSVVSAATAVTPNPPVILRAEGGIRSVQISWSPSPMASEDPLKVKGYKLYRSLGERGIYQEAANLPIKEGGGFSLDTLTNITATITETITKTIGKTLGNVESLPTMTHVDRNLADGADYYYKMTAYNERGMESDYSRPFRVMTLATVDGLAIEGDLMREVRLRWNHLPGPGIKGYHVWKSTDERGGFIRIATVEAATVQGTTVVFTDKEGISDDARFFYRVTAFGDGDVETSPSIVVAASTKGRPAAPTGLTAKSGLAKRVELSWAVSSDPSVTGYQILWSTTEGGPYKLLTTVENRQSVAFIDDRKDTERLADGTRYHYAIRSINRIGVASDLSAPAAATTKTVPRKPTGLRAKPAQVRQVSLSWDANPEKDVQTYHVYRNAGTAKEEFKRIGTVSGKTEYVDGGLRDGQLYLYVVVAEDSDGLQSELSDMASVRTKP